MLASDFVLDSDAAWRRELASLDPIAARHPASLDAARKLRAHGKTALAIEAYRAAHRLGGDNPALLRELSALLASSGRRDEAREALAEACRIDAQRLKISSDEEAEVAAYLLAREWGEAAPARAPAAYVQALFDRAAESFDDRLVGRLGYRGPQYLFEAVRQSIRQPAASLRILDAGCGTGLAAELLRPAASELEGVDLSPQMVEKARALGLYDRLTAGEMEQFLLDAAPYDLIFAADVFIHIGEVGALLAACRRALMEDGLLAFSVEEAPGEGYSLGPTGRFGHSSTYLGRTLLEAGFTGIEQRRAVMRREAGKPVDSLLFTAHVR